MTPAVKDFPDALDRYSPGTAAKSQFTANMTGPWAAGELFGAAAILKGGS